MRSSRSDPPAQAFLNRFRSPLLAVVALEARAELVATPPTGTGFGFAERSAALHQKARLEPRRRDAVELDRAAAAQ